MLRRRVCITAPACRTAPQRTTGQSWSCDVGYERFLGPEIFFNPEILRCVVTRAIATLMRNSAVLVDSSDFIMPLPEVVDESILKCPIDTRRGLYKARVRALPPPLHGQIHAKELSTPAAQNIVLSGGSTMFKDFGRRLQRDIKKRVRRAEATPSCHRQM